MGKYRKKIKNTTVDDTRKAYCPLTVLEGVMTQSETPHLVVFYHGGETNKWSSVNDCSSEVGADVGAVSPNQRRMCPRPVALSDPLQLRAAHSLS